MNMIIYELDNKSVTFLFNFFGIKTKVSTCRNGDKTLS